MTDDGHAHREISAGATPDEEGVRIENAKLDLYRQMDAQDPVFSDRETASARGVAPPPRKRVSADADEESSQP